MELDAEILWFVAGLALVLLEFVVPGVVLVFFGLAAWVVAAGMWIGLIDSLAAQSIVFCVTSLLLLFGLRRYVSAWFVGGTLNRGTNVDEEFIGKKVRVVQSIDGGDERGKVELKGAEWNATCAVPLAAGSYATIIERDGINLTVKPNQ